ncbi:MAG: hypothetical protein LCI00_23640 [Chloroflexi bacterium]|nr:hypothetical protein [Chloroflexota bacterium]MCC6896049.1 hypothetical protein [Anaerolineae bacterium]
MFFNNHPYDAVGASMVEEVYKQAEELYPISDEPLTAKPSVFQRVVRGLLGRTNETAQAQIHCSDCDELRGSV